jgi:hypothetical protein
MCVYQTAAAEATKKRRAGQITAHSDMTEQEQNLGCNPRGAEHEQGIAVATSDACQRARNIADGKEKEWDRS